MNILVVGRRQGLVTLLHALSEENFQGITHLADGAQALAELSQGVRHYKWVILEDQAIPGGGMDAAAVVRAMGSSSALPHLLPREGGQQWRVEPAGRRCGVEWDENGVLQLHCCLQQSLLGPQREQGAETGPAFTFEYHAPCRK